MVLTKAELTGLLKNEVRILLHLAGKIDRAKLDYRPSAKQRSTIELLRYLAMMGPTLIEVVKAGKFDPAVWGQADAAVKNLNYDEVVAKIASQADAYASLVDSIPDADFRQEIVPFGQPTSRGVFIVNYVLSGCAAYRTQLFLYLKACGHDELNTMNLWGGVDQ